MSVLTVYFDIFLQLWWLLAIALIISILRLPRVKGAFGEFLVKWAAKRLLPEETYRPFHNVTLPTEDGTTQIDHIYVSKFGLFVVETKHMQGWIFGSEKQAQWTQSIFRKSFKFQNPLRQNYKHTKTLEAALGISKEAIHSVIVFTGNSTLKTEMPENVTKGIGFVKYIKSFDEVLLSEEQVSEVCSKIEEGRLQPNRKTHKEHVKNLQEAAREKAQNPWCPKCGKTMVLRKATKGANAGNQFWGCSGYPACRAVLKGE